MTDDVPAYQWSKFSPDRSEQFVIRSNDWTELIEKREEIIFMLPKDKPFPDDSGKMATPPERVQTSVPSCPVHGVPMTLRHGKFGDFWSCGKKNADGSWCKAKPTV